MIEHKQIAEISFHLPVDSSYEADVAPLWRAYREALGAGLGHPQKPQLPEEFSGVDAAVVDAAEELANEMGLEIAPGGMIFDYLIVIDEGTPDQYDAYYARLKERLAPFSRWLRYDNEV